MVMGVSVAVGVELLGSESPVVRVWNRLIANRPTTVVILYVGQKDKGFSGGYVAFSSSRLLNSERRRRLILLVTTPDHKASKKVREALHSCILLHFWI